MSMVKCLVCERKFDVSDAPSMPFCSERCRQIDLGRWLDEGYGMPIETGETGEDDPDEDV